MKKSIFILLLGLMLLVTAMNGFSADLLVPTLDLITRGYFDDDGRFVAGARGSIDLLVAGGYKFGGRLILNMESDNLEQITAGTTVQFKTVSVTARELFGMPFNLSYFIGQHTTFCNGDIFTEYFGAERFATNMRGFLYYPEGIRYDGIHNLAGTGLAVTTSPNLSNVFLGELYLYQDSYLGKGFFSSDLRTLINLELFKFEAFAGSSLPVSTAGLYRAGVLMLYKTPEGVGEFLSQIGIPRWDPVNDPFSIDLFYFLFEPRVRIGFFSIILTLFWHPEYYNRQPTNELGTSDLNVNFLFGEPEKSILSGGLEGTFTFSTSGEKEQFKAVVSPYFSAITAGVVWNLKIKTKVFPFEPNDFIEGYIGVKAEF